MERTLSRGEENWLYKNLSKVCGELTWPINLYVDHKKKLAEGKRKLYLDYDKNRRELSNDHKLKKYSINLERKLQEPGIFKKGFGKLSNGVNWTRKQSLRGAKYIRDNYDFEKEKREVESIYKGINWTIKKVEEGTKYIQNKYDWEKEKRQAEFISNKMGLLVKNINQYIKLTTDKIWKTKKSYSFLK
ncbi:hypothetical protein CMI40_00220 [Candidatus Pacearchaeota archaeon]|jgi:hypothetical protein|nr:hypothetical protein [Candidatus Pacearchaeota archaeon]|tara:strand:+ start:562 stop:1125 length:564 start_codon:yes stop_codon:yes gene_type:complete